MLLNVSLCMASGEELVNDWKRACVWKGKFQRIGADRFVHIGLLYVNNSVYSQALEFVAPLESILTELVRCKLKIW